MKCSETRIRASAEQMQEIDQLGNGQGKLHRLHNDLFADYKKLDVRVNEIRQDLDRLQINVKMDMQGYRSISARDELVVKITVTPKQ